MVALPQSNARRSRRRIVVIAAVVLALVITFAGYYAWRTYVDISLRNLGWSASRRPNTGYLDCFPSARTRFAWPLRYKSEWTGLSINGCTITVRDANDLAAATQIENLRLSCAIEPGAFAPLARLPRLTSLTLSRPNVSPADLRDLRASKGLKELYVVNGSFREGLFEAIAEIASLERIELQAFVKAEELEPLTRLPNLRFLAVLGLRGSPGLVPIFKRMNRLEEVHFLGSKLVGPAGAFELSEARPDLRILPDGFVPRTTKSRP